MLLEAVAGVAGLVATSHLPARQEGVEPFAREALVRMEDERTAHLLPPVPRELSKKEAWLRDKVGRRGGRVADRDVARAAKLTERRSRAPRPTGGTAALPPPGARIRPVTTLFNIWTREALPIVDGAPVQHQFHRFLRDHYTNQATEMDTRLIEVLTRVATRFSAARVEVVSGYRSPKYNLMLRKKGREVARASQHTEGNAVDFRIRGVPTQTLLRFVRSLRRGGVGYYPRSQFVHADTGRIRFWRGS